MRCLIPGNLRKRWRWRWSTNLTPFCWTCACRDILVFELCKTLTSFSATQLIPVFVISGEGGAKAKDFCRDLGAAAYFEKPVDFKALRDSLEQALHSRRQEGRKEVRVGLRVPLKLSGKDANGAEFSLPSTTDNVSKGGFLCACAVVLTIGAIVDVYMLGTEQEHVGKARIVRAEWAGTQYPRYGFVFTEMIGHWALQ